MMLLPDETHTVFFEVLSLRPNTFPEPLKKMPFIYIPILHCIAIIGEPLLFLC